MISIYTHRRIEFTSSSRFPLSSISAMYLLDNSELLPDDDDLELYDESNTIRQTLRFIRRNPQLDCPFKGEFLTHLNDDNPFAL